MNTPVTASDCAVGDNGGAAGRLFICCSIKSCGGMARPMNRAIAVVCLVVALAGFGWAYERVNRISSKLSALTETVALENNRLQVRTFAIKSQLAQARLPIVFIGDSITEGAFLPSSICGLPLVNAGIGGETAFSYAKLAKNLFSPISIAVVAIGTNDAVANNEDFRENYERLLDAIPAQKLVLVGAPPIEESPTSRRFDAKQLAENNRVISQIAAERHLPLVNPTFLEGPNTIDGVHLSPAGYQQWLPPIIKAVADLCAR